MKNEISKSLLVVVDYQNDFVAGSLGFSEAKEIYPNVLKLVKEFELNNDEIIFTKDTHEDDYLNTIEGKKLSVIHCLKDSFGSEFYNDLEKISINHVVLEKETFPCIKLVDFLKNKTFKTIHICGVVTNICVISNAVLLKAIFPNTPIYVHKSACASNSKILEHEAFDIMENLHMEIVE